MTSSWISYANVRVHDTEAALLGSAPSTSMLALANDTGKLYKYYNGSWNEVTGGSGSHPDLATHDALGLATDTEVTTAVSNHAGAADPHVLYALDSDLTTHAGAADPHTGYVREADASWVDLTDLGQTTLHSHAGGGAPTTADYLVGTADAGLSAEIVVGTTPGGELGGTWGAPTVDATHSGSAHHTRQHTITETLDHSFPGGSAFLRADGVFAAPPGGSEAFPVGSVFIAVVSTNPATLLGYGTWAAFAAGRMLVGLDAGQTEFDLVEETGGAKTHTLATSEMPAHAHVQNSHNHTQDAHTHVQNSHLHDEYNNSATTGGLVGWGAQDTSTNTASLTGYDTGAATAVNQNATATNQAATATDQNAGGGGAHNNLPPYIVVYMWKRTA